MERITYSAEELLANIAYDSPLIANGVRCHGGFVGDHYVSPRSLHRNQAIAAWQAQLAARGVPLIDIPAAVIPPHYPNPAQAKLLLREQVRDPLARTLTTIAIIEGFGAMIRDQRVPDWSQHVKEPLDGMAVTHLKSGLFEAHARDEAGFRSEGGHKQMWEAARDLGLDNPSIPSDVLMRLMTGRGGGGQRQRLFPQLDEGVEELLSVMATVLVIEIFAADTFHWAADVLGDPEVSAHPQEAAAMVGYIRSDETPHVEYLRTALSELRACTLRAADAELEGSVVIDALLNRTLHVLTTNRPRLQREETRAGVAAAVATHRDAAGLQRRFDALETEWAPPAGDGNFVRLVSGAA